MAFNGNEMTPVGGNARSGENTMMRNAPMAWAYNSKTDTIVDVLAAGYFNSFNVFLVEGQYIYVNLVDGKFFITVKSVDRSTKIVVIDTETFSPGGQASAISIYNFQIQYDLLSDNNKSLPIVGAAQSLSGPISTSQPTFNISVNGSRFAMDVTAFTSGGAGIRIRGASVDPATGIKILNDNETIFPTQIGFYITTKYWIEIFEIVFEAGAVLTFTAEEFAAFRNINRSYKVLGYQFKALTNGSSLDFRFQIISHKLIAGNLYTDDTLEDISFVNDAPASIVDHLRSLRSMAYANTSPMVEGVSFNLTQDDFDSFFTNNENQFDPNLGEGIAIVIIDRAQSLGRAEELEDFALELYLQ